MKRLFLAYLLLFTLTTIHAQEKEETLFLSGYIKNLHEFSFIDNLDQLQWTTLLHNRLNFNTRNLYYCQLNCTYELYIL